MAALETDGFEWARGVVPPATVELLQVEADRLAGEEPDAAHGIRDLIGKSGLVREALGQPWLLALVPKGYACVRGILFDKTPGSNWLVAWHQDLTICVQERREVPGYGPWSVKHGVPHVQPPVILLEEMVTLRLHLDDTHAGNGALRVMPGSHLEGRLNARRIGEMRMHGKEVVCEAGPGDVLVMRPMLLHASSKAEVAGHRRVVHLEFARREVLAEGLRWHE